MVIAVALSETYPVNSVVSLTLETKETVEGTVYTTDEFSRSIVLRIPLVHTTLSTEVRIINAACVKSSKIVKTAPVEGDETEQGVESLTAPLPAISQKSLEEREKRAIRLAEESLGHINEKVRKVLCAVI